jgi:predicted nucleic acid-binding protein
MNPVFLSPVVCNTGPLIGLARVNLEWLPFRMFPEVIVPEEVREELLAKDSPDRTQLAQILKQARIHPRQPQPDRLLLAELDEGEAAVIATALQLGFPSVLLDERKARRVANRVYGLQVKGTAGLLVEAKNRCLIEAVRPHLEAMIQGGYFLGPNLIAACLDAAGEV